MASKSDLIKAAHEMGITDVDASWTKREIESEMASFEEKQSEETVEEVEESGEMEPSVLESKEISVDVGIMNVRVKPGEDGEFGTEDDEVEIAPVPVKTETDWAIETEDTVNDIPTFHSPIVSFPEPVKVEKPKVEAPAFNPNRHKVLSTITYKEVVYSEGSVIEMPAELAKVHIENGVLGPVDAIAAKTIRQKALAAGEYVLICDLTLNETVHKMGETIALTSEQADLYERIGAIEIPK